MAYVQSVLKKHKPATKTLSVEEREGAQANIFRLPTGDDVSTKENRAGDVGAELKE